MATDPDLRDMFRGIEVSDRELGRYRARLARELAEGSRRPAVFSVRPWLTATGFAVVSAAIAATLFLSIPRTGTPTLQQRSLEEVQSLVAISSDPQDLARTVELAETEGGPIERHNARLVRTLIGVPSAAIAAAVAGANEDPRAEFRSFYLDLLLDRADEWLIDSDRVAELMDVEPDPLCLALLGQMLKVAAKTGS